jgi:HSP20 family protein
MFSIVPFKRSRLVPSNIDSILGDPFFRFFEDSPIRQSDWSPAVDIAETEKEYRFVFEVPGMEQKNLSISVENHTLTISGEKVSEERQEEGNLRLERWFGKFSRSFSLPETADAEHIDANLKNGVLTVTVSKKQEATPRRVEVKVS